MDATESRAAASQAASSTSSPSLTNQADWTGDAGEDTEPQPKNETAAVNMIDSPSLVPSMPEDGRDEPSDAQLPVAEDIESIAARRLKSNKPAGKRPAKRPFLPIPGLPAIILVLVCILAGLIQWRSAIARTLPQTASLYARLGLPINIRGLEFQDVKTQTEFHDGMAVLIIEGTVVNAVRQTVEVPRLRFALRNAAGNEVYAWTALPARSILGSGEKLPFRSRLASPPDDGRDVIVRFFNRHDAAAGSH
jgi:hypothetical protein